jgi:hypothetical protein
MVTFPGSQPFLPAQSPSSRAFCAFLASSAFLSSANISQHHHPLQGSATLHSGYVSGDVSGDVSGGVSFNKKEPEIHDLPETARVTTCTHQ